jgi:hypothetical protein
MYFLSLPERFGIDPALVVGRTIGRDVYVVVAVAESPTFSLPLTPEQAAAIPDGAQVFVGPARWAATLGEREEADGLVSIAVNGTDSAPVCGSECDGVSPTGESRFASEIVLTPEVSGVAVPTAAVATRDGKAFVVDAGGAEKSITVLASSGGMTVIEGVQEGERVRVPAIVGPVTT